WDPCLATQYQHMLSSLKANSESSFPRTLACLLSDYSPKILKILQKWVPTVSPYFDKEHYSYVDHQITIQESLDHFGAIVWPKRKAEKKCSVLPQHVQSKKIYTLIVFIFPLGAYVTATDLPEVLDNLKFNISRNTQNMNINQPEVRKLVWGEDLSEDFPKSTHHYDFVLASDVVYHHTALDPLLATMVYLCQPGTVLLWANKFRFSTDFEFLEKLGSVFIVTLLAEFPESNIKLFKAIAKEN
uniref:Methyltransferase like 21C n=1 Tax=Pelusios castaneus TaxID=367368 RepID=A0A8C8SR68_9SAUR